MRRLFLLIVLLLSVLPLRAQIWLGKSEIGVTVGGMNYIGDLNDQSMLGGFEAGAGLMARINFNPRWAIAVGVNYGHLSGGNPDVIVRRNLSFRTSLTEAFARVEFNFFEYGLHHGTQKRATPYIFCGIGMFHFNPMALYGGPQGGEPTWYELQPLCTEGQGTSAYPERSRYQLTQLCMPFGVGYRWRVSPAMHVTLEYGWRKTWTDYIDDVSTTYVGSDLLGSGSMAAILADRSGEVEPGYVNAVGIKRGDDSLDDWYGYLSVSVSFSAEMLFGWMRGKVCEK